MTQEVGNVGQTVCKYWQLSFRYNEEIKPKRSKNEMHLHKICVKYSFSEKVMHQNVAISFYVNMVSVQFTAENGLHVE